MSLPNNQTNYYDERIVTLSPIVIGHYLNIIIVLCALYRRSIVAIFLRYIVICAIYLAAESIRHRDFYFIRFSNPSGYFS